MQYPGLNLPVFLCVWIPAFHCLSIFDRLQTESKIVAKTIIVRLEHHPDYTRIAGKEKVKDLDYIPKDYPLDSLNSVTEVLDIFRTILSVVPINDVTYILTDLENLQRHIQAMIAILGCPATKAPKPVPYNKLVNSYSKGPIIVEKVSLDRFYRNLQNIIKYLTSSIDC